MSEQDSSIRARKIDRVMVKGLPNMAPLMGQARLGRWMLKANTVFPVLAECEQVRVLGSFAERTAVMGSSGFDVLCQLANGERFSPDHAIHVLQNLLGCAANSVVEQHGIRLPASRLGPVRFMPTVRGPSGCWCIPDTKRGIWLPTVLSEHTRAVLALGAVGRCIVRVAKLWNMDQPVSLSPFHIEAMVLDALSHTDAPQHFHWRIVLFFGAAADSLREHRGHPLMPSAVRFDYLSAEERLAAIDALTQARSIVWNAWFLAEADEENGYGLACHFYAKLLEGGGKERGKPRKTGRDSD